MLGGVLRILRLHRGLGSLRSLRLYRNLRGLGSLRLGIVGGSGLRIDLLLDDAVSSVSQLAQQGHIGFLSLYHLDHSDNDEHQHNNGNNGGNYVEHHTDSGTDNRNIAENVQQVQLPH